jgi:hypothetical protein
MKMHQSAAAFTKAGHFRALKIDLAVERHEQLHCLYLLIVCGERPLAMNELVGEVFDGVAKNLKGMSGLRGNMPALCV